MSFHCDLKNHLDHRQNIWPDDDDDEEEEEDEEEWPSNINDYNLFQLIGHGTFGRVFRSYCKQNGKECAIKCVPKRNCSPNFDKILTEVHIHIRLKHPRILQLFTVLEDAKAVYLVMEICHGGSLSQLLGDQTRRKKIENIPVDHHSANPTLSYPVISTIIIQICDALDYLHRNSIVHRDINSNNILLVRPFDDVNDIDHCGEIQIKLADFGLAIDQKPPDPSLNDSLFGTTICGTPGFISPEVWTRQQKASYKSDIFSLGSILFACITGHTPKGDVDISLFLPMVANLLAQLWNPDPEKRPTLEQIRQHIFVSGRLDTNRLVPIEKQTKTLKMSLDTRGDATMNFVKENLTMKIVQNGSRVSILNKHHQTIEYGFYELPEKYWKHYLYVSKFVNLVKSKTNKITVHCSDWFPRKASANEEVVVKCVLMANGDFEMTTYNEILDEHYTFSLLHQIVENHDSIVNKKNSREFRLVQLYRKVLHLEKELSRISGCLGQNLFPITMGFDHKLLANNQQQQQQHGGNNHPLTENNFSFLTSEIFRSIPIQEIGHRSHSLLTVRSANKRGSGGGGGVIE